MLRHGYRSARLSREQTVAVQSGVDRPFSSPPQGVAGAKPQNWLDTSDARELRPPVRPVGGDSASAPGTTPPCCRWWRWPSGLPTPRPLTPEPPPRRGDEFGASASLRDRHEKRGDRRRDFTEDATVSDAVRREPLRQLSCRETKHESRGRCPAFAGIRPMPITLDQRSITPRRSVVPSLIDCQATG